MSTKEMAPAPGEGSTFGDRVTYLAALRGVTLNKLGEPAGITSGLISRWSRTTARPAPEAVKRLADAWSVSFEWLACGTGPVAVDPGLTEIALLRSDIASLRPMSAREQAEHAADSDADEEQRDQGPPTVRRRYFIQDSRQYVGNSVLWWGPNHGGYVVDLDAAGEYDEEEARRIERGRNTDKAIPVEIARGCASRHVDAQRLHTALRIASEKGEARAAGVDVLTEALTAIAPYLPDGDEPQTSSDTETIAGMLLVSVEGELGGEVTRGHLEGLADLLRGVAKIVEAYQPERRRSADSEGGA